MARKHNKRKKQKPNFSKRERHLNNSLLEIGKDLDLEDKVRKQKSSSSPSDSNVTSPGGSLIE